MRWNPDLVAGAPVKKYLHRSLDDIEESIKELFYYREHFFKTKNIPAVEANHSISVERSGGTSRKTTKRAA